MYVVPAEGLKIRDPYKRDYLPPEGREIQADTNYWRRLERDKDVAISDTAPGKSKAVPARPSSGGE